jgi:hypothetical protein
MRVWTQELTRYNVRHQRGPTRLPKSSTAMKRRRKWSERTATHVLVAVFDIKVYFARDLRAASSLDGLRAENGRE